MLLSSLMITTYLFNWLGNVFSLIPMISLKNSTYTKIEYYKGYYEVIAYKRHHK